MDAPGGGGSFLSKAAEALWLEDVLANGHLFQSRRRPAPPGQRVSWRIGTSVMPLREAQRRRLVEIGEDLWALALAEQEIYHRASRDADLRFVQEYLDQGKPEELVRFSQMRRLRGQRPPFLRPDLLVLADGAFVATEIDSVPGGFGELGALQDVYASLGQDVLGGPAGIPDAFWRAMQETAGKAEPVVAIVVSQESEDYRPEMEHLALSLRRQGRHASCVGPKDVVFHEDGLYVEGERVDVLYRFFELFDLRNVPKADLFLYAQRKGLVQLTPPIRPQFEEKLWFALLHHPLLTDHWQDLLGVERLGRLRALIPESYVLDPRPVPPHAVVAGLELAGRPVRDVARIAEMSKRERARWVLKPSGFSPLAWGSRGVHIGEDTPQEVWAEVTSQALRDFARTPWILQRYHKAAVLHQDYYDFAAGQVVDMAGRARLCPYYFHTAAGVELGGVLATICPQDKKVLHGMVDAIMVPAGGL